MEKVSTSDTAHSYSKRREDEELREGRLARCWALNFQNLGKTQEAKPNYPNHFLGIGLSIPVRCHFKYVNFPLDFAIRVFKMASWKYICKHIRIHGSD